MFKPVLVEVAEVEDSIRVYSHAVTWGLGALVLDKMADLLVRGVEVLKN